MNESAGGVSGAAGAGPDTPGGMLRVERERRGYSVQHAAEELHLDVRVIEALEANRFAALGAPVYAKGHLRKYAALLGLSPATVVERYEALSGTPSVPTPIPAAIAAPITERRRVSKLPLLIVVAIVVVAAAAWFGFKLLRSQGSDSSATSEVAGAAEPQLTASEPMKQPPVATASTQPATPRQVSTAGPATQPPSQAPSLSAAPAAVAVAGEVRMRLEFTEPSWAEIYDATGRRLMFDMGTPGRVRTVAGVPPLRVNIGLASAVSAQIDDRPIVIPRRAGRNDARFQIEADGSVRTDISLQTAER
jgi:cytoskeleton protein RodZ